MQQYNIPNVSIKWPNDIYAGNKKIAGILIENNIQRFYQWTNAVVGIGLNVNQEDFFVSEQQPLP
jgi:BirA family biotin operon repressor/biotin-[acetyl-CoA-carboxylase] ligase